MSTIKQLMDTVAAELGIRDPNDPAVLQEVDRRLAEPPPECGVDCHCDDSESCQ